MRHRYSLIGFVLLVTIALPMFASHGWSNYHWGRPCNGATGCEASIEVRRSLTATTYSNWPDFAYKAVFGDPSNPNTANRRGWNDSTVLALNVTNGSSDSSYRSSCPSISGAVRVCNYTYGSNGWLGLAQLNLTSGTSHIAWATTKLNDTYFNTSSYPNTERRHVACQEIGHDFGLGHTSENGTSQNTCMDYYKNTSNSDWASTGPNQHDFDQLLAQHHAAVMYNPGQIMAQSLRDPVLTNQNLNEPWQWGTPIEWDEEGRARIFVLDRGEDEDTLITFVYWVHADRDAREPRNAHPEK
jgi:hypothetical protein